MFCLLTATTCCTPKLCRHYTGKLPATMRTFAFSATLRTPTTALKPPTCPHYGKNENDAFTYQQISGKIFSRVAVWCKLYRRGFIRKRKIEFPEGFVFEDVIFHIKTITSAGKICLLNRPLYCYRTDNAASITHVSAATTQLLDIVEAFDMVYDYLKEKKLLPSLSLHFCRFLYDHAGWHLKRAAEKPQKQLAEKTLSWINRHDDIRQTINADPVLQSFYSSLSPENRQTPFR